MPLYLSLLLPCAFSPLFYFSLSFFFQLLLLSLFSLYVSTPDPYSLLTSLTSPHSLCVYSEFPELEKGMRARRRMKVRPEQLLELKKQASALLLSVMESRQDEALAQRILFNMDKHQLIKIIYKLYSAMEDADDGNVERDITCTSPCACPMCRRDVGHSIYVLAVSLAHRNPELALLLQQRDLIPGEVELEEEQLKHHIDDSPTSRAIAYYARYTDSIEIVRNGRLEQIHFPIPAICNYLSENSKLKVMEETDVDEQNSKVPGFFRAVYHLFEEMKWQKRLKSRNLLYEITILYSNWKSQAFVFALLLNILVAVSFPYETAHFDFSWRALALVYFVNVLLVVSCAISWHTWHARTQKKDIDWRIERVGM